MQNFWHFSSSKFKHDRQASQYDGGYLLVAGMQAVV
jgi:hypothetical protein